MTEPQKDLPKGYDHTSVFKAIREYGDEMMAREVYPTKDKYRDGKTYKELANMTKEQWSEFLESVGAPEDEKPLTTKEMLDRFTPVITGAKNGFEPPKGEEKAKEAHPSEAY